MAVEKRYARLGFFLLVVLIVAIATSVLFIQRLRSQAVFEMVTYTVENISGLDVSSPVKYRGVPIGRVTNIRVSPQTVTIEIDFELFVDRLITIGSDITRLRGMIDARTMEAFRTQLVSNPVTGEAYLLLDLPDNPPPPMTLGFTPARTYIPSMPSMMSTVKDRLPEFLDRAQMTLDVLREIVSKIPDSLDRSNRFFTNIERIFQESELPALSADSRKFFTTTSAQIDQLTSNLDRLVGTNGTLVAFVDETRAAVKSADFVLITVGAGRAGQDEPRGRRAPALPAGHSGIPPAAPRAGPAARVTAGVNGTGQRPPKESPR